MTPALPPLDNLRIPVPRDWWSTGPSGVAAPSAAIAPSPTAPQQPNSATSGVGDQSEEGLKAQYLDLLRSRFGAPAPPSANSDKLPSIGSGGFLDAIVGPTTDSNLSSALAAPGYAPYPTAPYGVIPKYLPPEFRVPRPISDWQRPESDFAIDGPRIQERIQRALATGQFNPNEPIFESLVERDRRNAARAAQFLFHGSGNFVSGDWDNIDGEDVADLALSAAMAVGPQEIAGLAARVGAGALRAVRAGGRAIARTAADEAAQAAARGVQPLVTGPKQPQYVVRGGLSEPKFLQDNAGELIKEGHPGLYGISSWMDPNSRLTPEPIAIASDIPHRQLTYTFWPDLDALGYKTIPTPYDDKLLHASILLKPGETTLSEPDAKKISALLKQNLIPNPNFVKPPKPPQK
jgi:hypothetical protein